MNFALVQGASRGIGLQFCKHLLSSRSSEFKVIATCRNPHKAPDLQKLSSSYPNSLQIFQLDVSNETEITEVSSQISEFLRSNGRGKEQGLDLLINSAGMLHPSGRGETSLKGVSQEGLASTFSTNAVGPLLMAKHFGEHLAKGNGSLGKHVTSGSQSHSGILVNMSARVGSITDNKFGGWYSYRMSKSALNMATKNLSIELGRGRRKVICVALHPGTVDTDLSRPYHRNVPADKLFSVEYSVESLMTVINNLTLEDSGKFFAWDGEEIAF